MVVRRKADLLIDHLMALSAAELRGLPRRLRIRSLKNKAELRERLAELIGNQTLSTETIVEFLDQVTPWGKQHVFLYRGPSGVTKNWRKASWVRTLLKKEGLEGLLGKSIPLVLPEKLTLASIQSSPSSLRITAIRRREGWVRDYSLVKHGKTPDGREVEYRGFVRQVLRGLVAFEWDLVANEAMLQVSQLPTGGSYEGVETEFATSVASWLDHSTFTRVDVRRAISKLRKLEQDGKGKVQTHAIGMDRIGSRRVTLRSTSSKVPLLGDTALDDFIQSIESDSVPRISDYYWEADEGGANQLDGRRTHFVVVGERRRVNFMTPSSEERIRDVLAELRRLSK